MMIDIHSLAVYLHNQRVGTLNYIGGERTLFSFAESYIEDTLRPTLGLRFKDRFGQLITEFRPYKIKLMPFFSNLLPEGILRTYLARKAVVHPEREFFLLGALGQDLSGAVRVLPEHEDPWVEEVQQQPDAERAESSSDEVLRFSLAGIQFKFSAVKDHRGGLTIPVKGAGGDWIVKLPSSQFSQVPENEFSMMTLAHKIGVNVPPIDLIKVESIGNLPEGFEQFGPRAYAIERFDRSVEGALHIEDFAQVFDVYPDEKYRKASFRNLLAVLASESGHQDVAEFIRRLTFNVLIGNGDMHLKNWSLIYPDRRNARLAPAYDFVSTIPYIPGDRSALKFSRTKDFSKFTFDELEHLAARVSLPTKLVIDTATETVQRFMEVWAAEKHSLPLESRFVTTIDEHLKRLPLLLST